jgi:hypothetical protein
VLPLLGLVPHVAFPKGFVNHIGLDIGVAHCLHDGSRNWDHLNLIFPVYMKLMMGFPSFQPEDAIGFFH